MAYTTDARQSFEYVCTPRISTLMTHPQACVWVSPLRMTNLVDTTITCCHAPHPAPTRTTVAMSLHWMHCRHLAPSVAQQAPEQLLPVRVVVVVVLLAVVLAPAMHCQRLACHSLSR